LQEPYKQRQEKRKSSYEEAEVYELCCSEISRALKSSSDGFASENHCGRERDQASDGDTTGRLDTVGDRGLARRPAINFRHGVTLKKLKDRCVTVASQELREQHDRAQSAEVIARRIGRRREKQQTRRKTANHVELSGSAWRPKKKRTVGGGQTIQTGRHRIVQGSDAGESNQSRKWFAPKSRSGGSTADT